MIFDMNMLSSSPAYASKASVSHRCLSPLPNQRIAAPQRAARAGASLHMLYGTEAQQPVRSPSILGDMFVNTNNIFEVEAGQHRPAAGEAQMAGSFRDLSAFGSPFRTSHDNVLYDDSSIELTPFNSLPHARLIGEAVAATSEPVVGKDQGTRNSPSKASQTCQGANTPATGTMATVACLDGSEADGDVIVREFLSDSAGKGCSSAGAGGATLEQQLLNAALQQPIDMKLTQQLSEKLNLRKMCERKHCPEQRYREEKEVLINTVQKAALVRSTLLANGVAPEVAKMHLRYLYRVLDTLKDKVRGRVFPPDCSAHTALCVHKRESQRFAAAEQGLSPEEHKSLEKVQELLAAIVSEFEGLLQADEQGDEGLADGHQEQLYKLKTELYAWLSRQNTKWMLAYHAYLKYLSSYRLLVCVAPGLVPASERQCNRWAQSSNGHLEVVHVPTATPEVELANTQLLGATWQCEVPVDALSLMPCIEDAQDDQQCAYHLYTHAWLDRKHLPAVEIEAISAMCDTDLKRGDNVHAMPSCQSDIYCPIWHSLDGALACVTGPNDLFAAQKLVKAAYQLAVQAQAGLDPSDVDALNKYKAQHSKVLESEENLKYLSDIAKQTGPQQGGFHPDFDLEAYLEDGSGSEMTLDACWQHGTDASQGLSQALDEVGNSYNSALAELCSMHDVSSAKLREAMSAHSSWITILLHLSGQQPQHRFYTEDLPLVFAAHKTQCRIPLADWKAIKACYDNSWGNQTCQPSAQDSTCELPSVPTCKPIDEISLQPSTDLNIECDQTQEEAAAAAQKAAWEKPCEQNKLDGLQPVVPDAVCKQAEGNEVEAMFAIDAMKRQASSQLLAAFKGEEEMQFWDVALCGRESDMAAAYGRSRVGAATAKGLDGAVINRNRSKAARQAAAAKVGLSLADMKVLQKFRDLVCSMWDATEARLAAEAATTP